MRPPTSRPSSERLLDTGFLAALAFLGGVVGLAPITNNDIWLHLATGRWMLDNGRLPAGEVFSYVAAGRPYVAHEWASELAFISLYLLGGLAALTAFKVATGALLAAWTYLAARRRGAGPSIAAAATGLAAFVMGAHLWVRPHVLSWFAVLALIGILRQARGHPARLLWLLPLQLAWTSTHGSFLLGPLLVLGWAAGEVVRSRLGAAPRGGDRATTNEPPAAYRARPGRLAAFAAACGLASLINPYGVELLRLPFELTSSDVFMSTVYEWQSPFTSSYRSTTMFAGFLVLTGLLLAGWLGPLLRGRAWTVAGIDPCEAIIAIGLLALACRMNRNIPLFALVAAPIAAAGSNRLTSFGGVVSPLARRFVRAAVITGILGGSAFTLGLGYPYRPGEMRARGVGLGARVPVAAVDYVESNHLGGNAFTTYGEGAYVVWRLWPHVRVSMDSRNSVYGDELYGAYQQALQDDAGAARYLDRWPPDLAIVGHDGPFRRGHEQNPRAGDRSTAPVGERDAGLPHRALLANDRLALVDFDDVSAVYVAHQPQNDLLIARDAYRVIHPVLLPAVFPKHQLDTAVAEAERATHRHPDAVLPRWILARAYAQARRPTEALQTLRAMEHLDTHAVQSWGVGGAFEAGRLGLVGLLEMQQGNCAVARDALLAALDADPRHVPSQLLLADLDCR